MLPLARSTDRNGDLPPHLARYAWPAGVAAAGAAWYASDSLRHRREGGRGYELHGEAEPGTDGFCEPQSR